MQPFHFRMSSMNEVKRAATGIKADAQHGNNEPDFFQLTNEVFARAERFKLNVRPIRFEPVRGLTHAISAIYGSLDRSVPVEASVARLAWKLRSTVLFTLLPFDDPELKLETLTQQLVHISEDLPGIREYAEQAKKNVSLLLAHPENPKCAVIREIRHQLAPSESIGVIATLCAGPVPGWPTEAKAQIVTLLGDNVFVISSRRELRYFTFHTLILPAGLRHCPPQLASDAVHGCRAFEAHLLKYETESAGLPERSTLPETVPFTFAKGAKIIRSQPADVPQFVEAVDAWMNESYWEKIHSNASYKSDQLEETEAARFAVFLNGKGAFLPSEGKVIEVSNLVDGVSETNETDSSLKKRVSSLEEGDLIVIRTSGGGDYVELIADTLLARAGKSQLRTSALDWKPMLRAALQRNGTKKVAEALRKNGVKLPFLSYLHNWAGDLIMCPKKKEVFVALILSAAELTGLRLPDAVRYAHTKWSEMEDLKSFHHRAGQKIRRELLAKVNELVDSGCRIDTELRISLPHVEGGEMSILRIAAIDRAVLEVPRSRLFRLEQAELV